MDASAVPQRDNKENDVKNGNTTKQRITLGILRTACVTALGMAFAFALTPAAHAQTITPPAVPAGLEVLAPNEPFLLGRGVGTQNYICQPTDTLGHVAWTLFTPQATLFDDQGEQLTTHFFSPNRDEGGIVRAAWQDSGDTSTVWARAIAFATVRPDAIDWLLLAVVGAEAGPTGGDSLSGATFLQRVNTEGGLAPATGCEVPTDIGRKRFVPYKADYFFYKQN